jgi:hypothetical protein
VLIVGALLALKEFLEFSKKLKMNFQFIQCFQPAIAVVDYRKFFRFQSEQIIEIMPF